MRPLRDGQSHAHCQRGHLQEKARHRKASRVPNLSTGVFLPLGVPILAFSGVLHRKSLKSMLCSRALAIRSNQWVGCSWQCLTPAVWHAMTNVAGNKLGGSPHVRLAVRLLTNVPAGGRLPAPHCRLPSARWQLHECGTVSRHDSGVFRCCRGRRPADSEGEWLAQQQPSTLWSYVQREQRYSEERAAEKRAAGSARECSSVSSRSLEALRTCTAGVSRCVAPQVCAALDEGRPQ